MGIASSSEIGPLVMRSARVRPLDQFHDQCSLFHAIDGGDIRMVERCQHLSFAGEARQPVGIGCERFGQDFDGDVAVQLGVCGSIDGAHSALAEFGRDAVVSDDGRWIHAELVAWYHLRTTTARVALTSDSRSFGRRRHSEIATLSTYGVLGC